MDEPEKKLIVLGFEDVLVPGKVVDKVNEEKVKEILKELSLLEKEGKIKLVLAAGIKKGIREKKLAEHGLKWFFKEKNIHHAHEKYISKREEIDQKRHKEAVEKNPAYDDEYLKVQVVQHLIEEGTAKEEIVFFGHDLMSDAYYLKRYCGIDCALLKKHLSFRNEKTDLVKGLIYVNLDWEDFKKVIYGKKKAETYALLEHRVFAVLKKEIFGDQLLKAAAQKAIEKKLQEGNN